MPNLFGNVPLFIPRRIVSGGQTGVDRAALDVAILLKIEHGGWCPAGRLAEDGPIPSCYALQETRSNEYPVRTEQNIADSSATLILHEGKLKGGTLLTRRLCDKRQKPYYTVKIGQQMIDALHEWLAIEAPEILNVAGPRESSSPGIHSRCKKFLLRTFSAD
ncbi:MAG: hypothetical protein CMM01_02385 [Rhodopirellula sp.]|nr:hypothetical protein [Rhodopirellula sp.]